MNARIASATFSSRRSTRPWVAAIPLVLPICRAGVAVSHMTTTSTNLDTRVEEIHASAYEIPTATDKE